MRDVLVKPRGKIRTSYATQEREKGKRREKRARDERRKERIRADLGFQCEITFGVYFGEKGGGGRVSCPTETTPTFTILLMYFEPYARQPRDNINNLSISLDAQTNPGIVAPYLAPKVAVQLPILFRIPNAKIGGV